MGEKAPLRARASEFAGFTGDTLVFDANVLLGIYYADPGYPEELQTAYSGLLKRLLVKGSKLLVEQSVLSEVVNRIARSGYEHWRTRAAGQSFKEFRNSAAFEPYAEDIELTVNAILRDLDLDRHPIVKADAVRFAATIKTCGLDWTDLLLVDFCHRRGAYLVTHDRDFESAPVEILTENRRLLSD